MKNVLSAVLLVAAFFAVTTASAQITVTFENRTACDYEVFVNIVAAPGCGFTGAGTLHTVPAFSAPYTVTFAAAAGTHVPGFGVRQIGSPCPPAIVKSPTCTPSLICGYCSCPSTGPACIDYAGSSAAPILIIY